MTDLRARDCFDAGVAGLGLTVCDDPPPPRTAFTRATELDPTMGDAWLGRLASGDRSGTVLHGLYLARGTIGVQQRRVGLPRGALSGLAPIGLFIDYPITCASRAAAAYASSLIDGDDLDGSRRVLDDVDPGEPVAAYCLSVWHLRAGDWRAVLSATNRRDGWADPVLSAAADYVAGTACIQLGLYDEGIRLLAAARESRLDNCRAAATFAIGMALRTRGDEAQARACFQEAFALDPRLSDAARALEDPSYRLVVEAPTTVADAVPGDTDRAGVLAAADADLAAQIGLTAVKEQVERLRSAVLLANLRAAKGLRTSARSLHLTFTGPPGTGKTTVARIIARMYRGLGLLTSDTVVEVSRKDLVGEHLGSTAPKTSAVIDSALDGVLFIDEAYTLIQEGLSGGDAFGREALDTLLARMENDRDRLVVVLAGYDDEIDRLLAANEGLASRFARRIRFGSYSPSELVRIAESMAHARDARLSADAETCLSASFERLCTARVRGRPAIDVAGNGRFVRNVIEAAEEEREHRLASSTDVDLLSETDLMTLTGPDVRAALSRCAVR
ncbi:type VII secretion AAA-ATPase EccA [Gordonia sp. HY442]|uniref:type VII secretion AAA-ATPase EccA n=1 Tax=Gordonia zhenghanii TaxID=2911516 RepID=UPI001F01C558|nr:type VII secretion AAA-ATPase EccA [Gordonia zhenghanii]MCF8603100.1 type VII secretion AAA-ATPase EccA [Gordonia zhenghanii]